MCILIGWRDAVDNLIAMQMPGKPIKPGRVHVNLVQMFNFLIWFTCQFNGLTFGLCSRS